MHATCPVHLPVAVLIWVNNVQWTEQITGYLKLQFWLTIRFFDWSGTESTVTVAIYYHEEWCLLGCYAVKTSNLTFIPMFYQPSVIHYWWLQSNSWKERVAGETTALGERLPLCGTAHHKKTKKQTNFVALSPQTNYTDWAIATCRRNLVPTFVDRGVSRGQRDGSPTVVNLSFLDRSITDTSFNLPRSRTGVAEVGSRRLSTRDTVQAPVISDP
jgi:hypothetical protein